MRAVLSVFDWTLDGLIVAIVAGSVVQRACNARVGHLVGTCDGAAPIDGDVLNIFDNAVEVAIVRAPRS